MLSISDVKIKRNVIEGVPIRMEMMVLNRKVVESWEKPPFQRPVAEGKNIISMSVQMQDFGYMMSAFYLGVWEGRTYLVDGQHRRVSFISSGLEEIVAPVVTKHYPKGSQGLLEMCEDFLRIQQHIKNPTANDKLRALEPNNKCLQKITRMCPFVGYERPLLSMAQVIRSLVISGQEMPGSAARSAVDHARDMKMKEANGLITFLQLAYEAWGIDKDMRLMWSPMNMALCLWFFRRMLKGSKSPGTVTTSQFSEIFALLPSKTYISLLEDNSGGRMNDEDTRNPVAVELRRTIKKGLRRDGVHDYYMPEVPWI